MCIVFITRFIDSQSAITFCRFLHYWFIIIVQYNTVELLMSNLNIMKFNHLENNAQHSSQHKAASRLGWR